MRVVFVDPKCPSPYQWDTLRGGGLGGTEATVLRIARALSESHDVTVLQHNRVKEHADGLLRYLPGSSFDREIIGADQIIFIGKAQGIDRIPRSSKARLWLWLHNYLGEEVPFFWKDHLIRRLGIVCVSRTHALHTRKFMQSCPQFFLTGGLLARGKVTFIYNPIADGLQPDPSVCRLRHRLIFFSSPHKGIEQVVEAFRYIRNHDSRFELHVADPGYNKRVDLKVLDHPGIVRLGSLPHEELVGCVRNSLCVFYPQHKRPETFGLVYAEANAVGVPVLAHRFGSAAEILSSPDQLIDGRNPQEVLDRVLLWANGGSPVVSVRPEFVLSNVVKRWQYLLGNPDGALAEWS